VAVHNSHQFKWSTRPLRLSSEELPLGRTPIGVILVMEIGSGFGRLAEKKEEDFEGRSLKK